MGRRIQPLSIMLLSIDAVVVPVALWLASIARSQVPLGTGGALPASVTAVPWPFYPLVAVVWVITLAYSGAYHPQLSLRWFNEVWRVAWGAVQATVIAAGALYLSFRDVSRLQFVYFFVIAVGLLLGYRGLLRVYYRLLGRDRPGGRNRILVLGAGPLGQRVGEVLLDHSRWGFHPVGFLDDDPEKQSGRMLGLQVLGGIDSLRDVVLERRIDEVWVALPNSAMDRLEQVISAVETLPITIKVVPDYAGFAQIRTQSEVLGDLAVIGLRDPLIQGVPRLAKRLFDLAIGSATFILSLPLMAVIWMLIRLDSKGPVFIRQERVGENGRRFAMLKFRSMRVAAAEPEARRDGAAAGGVHKRPDDPRVTRVGRTLRRFSLDELPQLVNVIRGDMSLVGPRPEMPWLVDRYEPWQRKRFAVPQGLTGWWQINGRSDRPMHLHTEDDLYYVYNYSLWLDVKILLLTPWAVIKGKGAF
jgi:exopolysaccharide biosynthesis polyprenyl glycosylphosphotransferase